MRQAPLSLRHCTAAATSTNTNTHLGNTWPHHFLFCWKRLSSFKTEINKADRFEVRLSYFLTRHSVDTIIVHKTLCPTRQRERGETGSSELSGLKWQISPSCSQTGVDHLSNEPHIQWAINQQMLSHQHRLHTVTILLQWRLRSRFLNWNVRGTVSTHGGTEVTLNQTWKPTEIKTPCQGAFLAHCAIGLFVSDSGLQISWKHSSAHRRA